MESNAEAHNGFATQDVRRTGLYEDMHPGGFRAFGLDPPKVIDVQQEEERRQDGPLRESLE